MDVNESVAFFKKKYGNHSEAAKALGWKVRKYRDLRNQRAHNRDACRLLCLLAEKESKQV